MVNTNFTLDRKLSAQELKIRELVRNLLIVLSDKERFIITNRFALDTQKKLTLEEIGQHFGVTRERVRQIEQTALSKLERNAQNTNIKILTEFAKALLEKEGLVASDDHFKALLLKILPNITAEEIQDLHLALSLDSGITFEPNTFHFHPYWRMKSFDSSLVQKISTAGLKQLQKSKHVIGPDELANTINSSLGLSLPTSSIVNVLRITKECKFTELGIGLYSWRHIHPRTLKDKILYIFQREKKPLHFGKISDLIRGSSFDQKDVNIQAVHNELIRNESFILIGRGIYALKDWGYKTGTVSDVISEILADGKAKTREEITKAVLEQRHVKTITIYLNLKNKAQFARVGRDKYTLVRFA
ncbi:MAG: sigma factor-like helix-turn-helix DNA-binding protein [Candidatus Gracilibacteria bacterium]